MVRDDGYTLLAAMWAGVCVLAIFNWTLIPSNSRAFAQGIGEVGLSVLRTFSNVPSPAGF